MPRTMTLKNGEKVPQAIAAQTWSILVELHNSSKVEDQLALVELVKACRDRDHRVAGMSRRRLARLSITVTVNTRTGGIVINDDARLVVTLAVEGEAKRGKIVLVSPFKSQ